jgi:uncharacterized protein (TIGR02145 family)
MNILSRLFILVMTSLLIVSCGSGGGGTTNLGPDNLEVTVVNSYIAGADVTDANGNPAINNGDGTYRFMVAPTYPLTSSGGTVIATGEAFVDSMYAAQGEVISPVTNFLTKLDASGSPTAEVDSTKAQQLSDMYGGSLSASDLQNDYLASGNAQVAKLSQLLNVIRADDDLRDKFISNLSANTGTNSFTTAKSLLETALDNTPSINAAENYAYKNILDAVAVYTGTASAMESAIVEEKKLTNQTDSLDNLINNLGSDDASLALAAKILEMGANTASASTLTSTELTTIGVNATVSGNGTLTAMFNDAVKNQSSDIAVDTAGELQDLGDFIEEVANIANGTTTLPETGLTTAEMTSLGFTDVSDDILAAVKTAIRTHYASNGNSYPTFAEIQAMIDAENAAVENALQTIIDYTTGDATSPTLTTYSAIGVTGVSSGLLTNVNNYVGSTTEAHKNTAEKVQTIVNLIDGVDSDSSNLTLTDVSNLGLNNDIVADSLALFNEVLSSRTVGDIDTQSELSAISATIRQLKEIADGTATPDNGITTAALTALGIDTSGISGAEQLTNFLTQVGNEDFANISSVGSLTAVAGGDLDSASLSTISIASSNTDDTKAGAGVTVTLSITASEPINTPTVTIAGRNATVTNPSGNNWSASVVIQSGDTNTDFVISNITDLSGNPTADYNSTTDSSAVAVDTTIPAITSVSITSSNGTPTIANVADTITATIVFAEAIETITGTIAGANATISGSEANWSAVLLVDASASLGTATIAFDYTDDYGNTAQITSTTDSSEVVIDSAIKMTSVTMSTNNAEALGFAKVGDSITLTFATNIDTTGDTPTVTIVGKNATVTNAGDSDLKTFDATYVLQDGDTEGTVSFVISNYVGSKNEVGLNIDALTTGTPVVFDKTAPVITDNFTTQNEADGNLNNGGVSMAATDALSGILDNSYSKTADVNVDNAAITVGANNGLVQFASGFYPDYETKQTLTFELQVSDKAGNIGTNTVELTITDVVEASIVDVVYVENDTRKGTQTGQVQNSLYIFFSKDMNSSTISENDLTDYTGDTATFVVDQGEYISAPTASATRFAHVLKVTNTPTIATTDNLALAIGNSGNPNNPNITANSGAPVDASAQLVYGTESFDDYGNTYTAVVSPHSLRVWHSKNLGAAQVATAYNDASSYGSYFQWGRGADGHQINADATPSNGDLSAGGNTTTKATSTVAVDNKFITTTDNPRDWVEGSVNNSDAIRSANWSKTDGNSICPIGYRVPTGTELNTDIILDGQDWSDGDRRATAFNNFLKLPTAGNRVNSDGLLGSLSSFGLYWGSSIDNDNRPNRLIFDQNNFATVNTNHRSNGYSVRCIKD